MEYFRFSKLETGKLLAPLFPYLACWVMVPCFSPGIVGNIFILDCALAWCKHFSAQIVASSICITSIVPAQCVSSCMHQDGI